MNGEKKNNLSVTLIYPFLEAGKKAVPDADFFAFLTVAKSCTNRCRWLTFELNASFESIESIVASKSGETSLIYLHISDVTLLPAIRKLFSKRTSFKKSKEIIVVGGHTSISSCASDVLRRFPFIDLIVRYPYAEYTFLSFIDASISGRNWRDVDGITYRKNPVDGEGVEIVEIPLTSIPPNFDYIDNLTIWNEGQADFFEWYPIIISGGCFNNCRYCLNYQLQKPLVPLKHRQQKSATQVVDDIECLLGHGIQKFSFYCDQFFLPESLPENSSEEIVKESIRRKLKPQFRFITKPRELKENLHFLSSLQDAGLAEISVGIDSGLPRFHQMYRTGSTVDDIYDVLKALHHQRIKFDIIYVFFDPYLTLEEVSQTIDFLKSIQPYFSHLDLPYCAFLDSRIFNSALQLRAGMPIIEEISRDKLLIIDGSDFKTHPAARFKSPQVNLFYILFDKVNQLYIRRIRHLFYQKNTVETYGNLNAFHFDVVEKIVDVVTNITSTNIEDFLSPVGRFIEKSYSLVF